MAEEKVFATKEDKKAVKMSQVTKGRKSISYLQSLKDKGQKIVQSCPVTRDAFFGMAAELADVDILRICGYMGVVANANADECMAAAKPTILQFRNYCKYIHLNFVMETPSFASKEDALRYGSTYHTYGADSLLPMGVNNETLKFMADNYLNVFGHVGALSGWQTIGAGYVKIGKTAEDAFKIFKMAYEYQENGMKAMTVELCPMEVAQSISEKLRVPVIGIAAGAPCDGSEMVDADMFGMMPFTASHAKKYADFFEWACGAYGAWAHDVRSGAYPEDKHGWHMDPAELEKYNAMIKDF